MGLSLGSKVGEEWRFDDDGRASSVVVTIGGNDERIKKGLGISITARINSRILRFIRDITSYFDTEYERSGYIDSELLPLHMTLAKVLGDDEEKWQRFFLIGREGIEGNEAAMKRCFSTEKSDEENESDRAKREIEVLCKLYKTKGFNIGKLAEENLFTVIFMGLDNKKGRMKAARMLCRYLKEQNGTGRKRKQEARMLMKNILREARRRSGKEWKRMVRVVSSYGILGVVPCEVGLSAVEAEVRIYESVGKGEDCNYILEGFIKGLRNEWNCKGDEDRGSVWKKGVGMVVRLANICGDVNVYHVLKREEVRLGVADDLWKSRHEGGKMIEDMMKNVVDNMSLKGGTSVEYVKKLLNSTKSKSIQKEHLNFYTVRNNGIKLAHRIYKEGFIPDVIYVAVRGGTYLGNVISGYFNAVCGRKILYAVVSAHSYTDIGENGNIQINGWTHHPSNLKEGEKVLLVDDIFDSGKTINCLSEIILNEGIPRSDLKIAVHDYKYFPENGKKQGICPDYWCRRQDVSVWEGPRWIEYMFYELIGTSEEEFEENYYTQDPELRDAVNEIIK
ncbi:phosphoribosyl transferase domain protein [Encephalitozoon romaleae SJ-2008]|uniref:Phosphoribosyl transferase domain protein n=1 Tax=Encephalitozoon romaleae (strain SJ-2008) TaxID=1178016 RepID=I6ZT33_ENCRO|nr:phosphoribosyl transferase domain protein [Encephalitozoon romaleae SJ-2008]AFN82776.1 phosphoribosyl transferase domain protein [Encephalitozoon romaleae SJ-2008]